MKIDSKFQLRKVAGENMILLQGHVGGEMTRLIALNESSVLLWDSLKDKEFELKDAVQVLLDYYEVDEATAKTDAEKWISILKENSVIID